MSTPYTYKLEYSVHRSYMTEIYINTNNPQMDIKNISDDAKKIIENAAPDNSNNRSTCSFLCRAVIVRSLKQSDGTYEYRISYGRFGTCRSFCKSLLRMTDFGFDKFSTVSNILSTEHANIREVRHIDTDKCYTMETFKMDFDKVQKMCKRYRLLVNMLYRKPIKFLMPILGVCVEPNDNNSTEIHTSVGVVMPKFDTTLQQYFTEKDYVLDPDEITNVAYSLISGVMCLHNFDEERGMITHRNINMNNVYGFKSHCPDKSYLWTIGNYKTAKFKFKESFVMMSPEQIIKLEEDAKSDIWAIGIILYQLITKKQNPTPFHTIYNNSTKMRKVKESLHTHILGPIVWRMLSIDSDSRPTAADVLGSLDKLEKEKRINVNECRCAVPSSFNYITLD